MDNATIQQLIARWNPHFEGVSRGKWVGKIPREKYLRRLKKFLDIRHVLILSGVRRSGKSTLMYQMIQSLIEEKDVSPKNILYLQLEDVLITPFLKLGANLLEDIYKFYMETYNPTGKIYIFLDEIQGISEFNRWLNTYYESNENIKFVISGSRQSLTEGETATLLTGRNIQVDVYPLSFYEYLKLHKIAVGEEQDIASIYRTNLSKSSSILHHLGNYLHEGGFPEIVLSQDPEIKIALANAYYRDIVTRDVLLPNGIRNSGEVEALGLQILADFTNTHTYSSLSKPQKLSVDTIKAYLSYFEKASLFFESKFFSHKTKETQDIQRPRKIYVVDNGIRNFNTPTARFDLGRAAENVVFMELKKKNTALHYWKGKREIDFVLRNGKMMLLNVSYTDKLHERELAGIIEGLQEFNLEKGLILTKNYFETKQIEGKTVEYVPLWVWLILNGKTFFKDVSLKK